MAYVACEISPDSAGVRVGDEEEIAEIAWVSRGEIPEYVPYGLFQPVQAMEHGLVPVLDCRPRRCGSEPRLRLRLVIPRAWSSSAPTLHAALDALRPPQEPAPAENEPSVDDAVQDYLWSPFNDQQVAPTGS